jgi:hypothetical protein
LFHFKLFRRVNQAIYLICKGAREAAFRNLKSIRETLADEIINAAKGPTGTSYFKLFRTWFRIKSESETLLVVDHAYLLNDAEIAPDKEFFVNCLFYIRVDD